MAESRTFHQTSSLYSLPNDATEHERLDYQTIGINRMMHDRVLHAPVTHPSRILEIGARTGYVTRQLAESFSTAEVVVIDLSPVPSQPGSTRPVFIQGDFMTSSDPALTAAPFDLIFSRMLVYGIRDWPQYIPRVHAMLSEDGWLECQEIDASLHYDDAGNEVIPGWVAEQRQAFAANGVDMGCATRLADSLRDAGFVDVAVKEYRWMHGPWKGHPEVEHIAQLNNGPANFAAFSRVLGHTKTREELEAVRETMVRDMGWSADKVKHHKFYVVYGWKKRAGE